MARSPASDQAFFREVDEEVRRERMGQAARRYGLLVVALVIAALLAFGGYLLWRHHRETVAAERGEQFTAAMSALTGGRPDEARGTLDKLVAANDKAYAPLARLLLADMAAQKGQDADAAATFLTLSQDEAAPRPLRDLALVRATVAGFDRLAPQQVIDRMRPLAGAGRPWAGTAGELIAIAQIKLGRTREAGRTILAVVRDPTVPQSLRDRLSQIGGDIGVDARQAAMDVKP